MLKYISFTVIFHCYFETLNTIYLISQVGDTHDDQYYVMLQGIVKVNVHRSVNNDVNNLHINECISCLQHHSNLMIAIKIMLEMKQTKKEGGKGKGRLKLVELLDGGTIIRVHYVFKDTFSWPHSFKKHKTHKQYSLSGTKKTHEI